jgi:HEAT repeats/SIR2-like domain
VSGKAAFLVGAGFSYPYGVPTMRPFFSDFVAEAKIRYPSLIPTLDKALDKIEEEPDLESLLSVLNGASDSIPGLPEELVTDEIRRWASEAVALRSYLLSYIVERCEAFDRQKALRQCSPLLGGLVTTGVTIFSTNYDRVVEHVCRSAGIELSDGFERTPDQAPSPWHRDFGTGLALAKLHGSVSWYEDSAGEGTYLRLDRGYPLPGPDFHLSRGGNDLSPLMIVPTLEKQVLKDPYAYLSNLFADRLASTTLLVVMGSSLRDEHLASAIRFRADDLMVTVIGKGAADAATRLAPNRTVALEASLEDFLLNCTQDLLRLVEQANVGRSVDELEEIVEQFAGEQRRLLAEIDDLNEAERRSLREMGSSEPLAVLRSLSDLRGKANETIIDATLRLLDSSEADVRCAAAGNLGAVASKRAVEPLAQIALQDSSELVRIESALALSQIGTPEANEAFADYRNKRPEDGVDQLL